MTKENKSEKMVSFRISPNLHKLAKMMACRKDSSLQIIMRDALREYLMKETLKNTKENFPSKKILEELKEENSLDE